MLAPPISLGGPTDPYEIVQSLLEPTPATCEHFGYAVAEVSGNTLISHKCSRGGRSLD